MTGAAGLVLAAGAGTRFGPGAPKLLAEVDGRPLVEHALAAATAVLDDVVVVLGARAEEVLAAADLHGARPVRCPGWAEGQAASLRAGVAALPGVERVLVLVGDQPRVPPGLVAALRGDLGLRDLVAWRLVEAGAPVSDIDTPHDLEAVRREARAVL